MPLVLKDRVRETTTTTGTGTYTLAGAVTGFQSFSVIGNGNTTYYTATDGTNWEVGIGTYTSSGTTLARTTILESSNSGSAVSWGAGTKDVFVTYPAEKASVTFSSATKTANYTAAINEGVLTDTTAGAFTVTLPASPITGAVVVVADDSNSWGTNNLTIGRNGSTIAGLAEDLVCDISSISVQLIYDGTTWAVFTQLGANGGAVVTVSSTQTLTNKTISGSSNTLSNISLSTSVTGTLGVGNGGTGITSFGTGVATALGQNVSGSGGIALTTSPSFTTPVLGTPTSGTLSNCTVDGTDAVGFRNIPQNSQSAAYTLVAADSGKHIFHPSADTTARTWTIPANSSVPFAIGTAVTFINQNGAGVITIAITTDTMRLAGAGTTGSRTLAANGVATAIKVTSTEWIISGTGLT